MMQHFATGHQHHHCGAGIRAPRTRLSQRSHVCADCQRPALSTPLYHMNGKQYCEICLLAWCVSHPAIQADLLVARTHDEQEG